MNSAIFICMFQEPLRSILATSVLARAQEKGIFTSQIISLLERAQSHHIIDDTPYGGGPGELMKISVVAPIINECLNQSAQARHKKRVILMDPSGKTFDQDDARRLCMYDELIFVCGRYEGIDARIHHYADEALSVGDFVLSSGDLAAAAMFDATARLVPGVLGNVASLDDESHAHGRLEASSYTRPSEYEGHAVPEVFRRGNHREIAETRKLESLLKTKFLRPDLLERFPLSPEEAKLLSLVAKAPTFYPWRRHA